MKYILCETYPGSPKLHTVVEYNDKLGVFEHFMDHNLGKIPFMIAKSAVLDYSHWREYNPITLIVPVGSFLVNCFHDTLPIYKVLDSFRFINDISTVKVIKINPATEDIILDRVKELSISNLNIYIRNKQYKVFDDVKLAKEFVMNKQLLLSYEDIKKIYVSAADLKYKQSKKLHKLILNRLNYE